MSTSSGQWTGFSSKRNILTGKSLSDNSCLIASCGVKKCVTWGIEVSFPSTRLSINESTGVLVFVKKLFILLLLLLGFGEDFSKTFGKWLSGPTFWNGQFFNFKVLTSRVFSKFFCSIFSGCSSQLLSNFDLFNSSSFESKVTRSALFLASSSLSKMFCFSSPNDRSNQSNFLFVRSSACCRVNFACSTVFLRSWTQRYEVSDDALQERLGKFGFS